MIEVGRLADVEAWSAFIQLAPQFRKALLDSTVAITSKSCEQVQTQLKQGKKQTQFLQKAQQEDFGFEIKVDNNNSIASSSSAGSIVGLQAHFYKNESI